jgi:hypothetical protein
LWVFAGIFHFWPKNPSTGPQGNPSDIINISPGIEKVNVFFIKNTFFRKKKRKLHTGRESEEI